MPGRLQYVDDDGGARCIHCGARAADGAVVEAVRARGDAPGGAPCNAIGAPVIDQDMPLSMRSLLSADTSIPDAVRAGIAAGDPGSATRLMALGLTECEAAELLDDPCEGPSRNSGSCAGPWC